MFSVAAIKALQIYGIAIAVSMVVAVLIKLLVVLTSQVKPAAKAATAIDQPVENIIAPGVPDEVVAAITAAVAVVCGPYRVLHIGESKRSWANEGRIAQHSHQPRY